MEEQGMEMLVIAEAAVIEGTEDNRHFNNIQNSTEDSDTILGNIICSLNSRLCKVSRTQKKKENLR